MIVFQVKYACYQRSLGNLLRDDRLGDLGRKTLYKASESSVREARSNEGLVSYSWSFVRAN